MEQYQTINSSQPINNPIPKNTSPSLLVKISKLFVGMLVVLLFIYLFINSPTLFSQISFSAPSQDPNSVLIETVKTSSVVLSPQTPQEILESLVQSVMSKQPASGFLPAASDVKVETPPPPSTPAETSSAKPKTSNPAPKETSLSNNIIWIPKIGIKVPVVWNSPVDEQTVLDNLHNGVVHYAGTPLPGEGKGPVFISGHSSYYWWDNGKYKKVFATLDKLSEGDRFQIKYNDNIYTYEVYDKIVVLPEEVSILQTVNEPTVYLMTCVPVGTNQKRLIVKAKQV